MKYYYRYQREMCNIVIGEENGKIFQLSFDQIPKGESKETEIMKRAITQLDEYFAGKRKNFDLPIQVEGTEFQKKVWEALTTIPYGETISYKELAGRVNCPRGYRAVGGANNKNPLAIIVPCHRVIGANGSLVGFAAGIEIKEKLLDLERNMV